MNTVKKSISRINDLGLSVSVLTAAALLIYLPHIFNLGLYFDDWYILWTGFTDGAQRLIEVQSLDRPVQGWLFAFTFQLFGIEPLRWQAWQLFLRWSGALAALWALRRLAPGQTRFSLGGGLLFLLYPGYASWPAAVTMQTLSFAMNCGVLALAAALEVQHQARPVLRTAFLVVSFAASLVCFFLFEWMISFTLITLLLLVVQGVGKSVQNPSPKLAAVKQIALHWLPSALAAVIFLYWRIFVFVNLRAATSLDGLKAAYLQQPLQMGLRLGVELAKDVLETTVMAWVLPFYAAWNWLTTAQMVLTLAIGVGLALVTATILRELTPEVGASPSWKVMAVGGLTAAVLGVFIPVFANRDFRFDTILDRYSLAAIFGIVMMFSALASLNANKRGGIWLLAILISFAGMTQTATAFKYRAGWQTQHNLWQQISWRAPRLAEGTVLMPLLPADLRLQDDYEIWSPANLIYNRGNSTPTITAEILNPSTLAKLAAGIQEERNMRTLYFVRDFSKALVISYPNQKACARILDGQSLDLSLADDGLMSAAGQYSRPADLIFPGESPALPGEIFGLEAKLDWCYFYQKADLARQTNDWQTVLNLGDEARAQGLKPVDGVEWLPFIDAYYALGRPEEAAPLLEQLKNNEDAVLRLCQRTVRVQNNPSAALLPKDEKLDRRNAVCLNLLHKEP